MIIKIMKTNRTEFWMCDNVENLSVEEVKTINNEGIPIGTESVICSIYEDYECPKKTKTWAIHFLKRGDNERYIAMFNTVAYICNDQGKTVETIIG